MSRLGRGWHAFSFVFQHEGRVLWTDRSMLFVGGILLMLAGYSLYNGVVEARIRSHAMTNVRATEQAQRGALIAQLRRISVGAEVPGDPFANPVNPATVAGAGQYAIMPATALSPLAFGQSDLFPSYYRVSHRSKMNFMDDAELENPWNLLNGRFDLAFVLTYLFPLLIFALSYNLLSAEREDGTLRLLLSQPLSLGTLVLGKVAVRAAALLICAGVIPGVALLVTRPEARSWDAIGGLGWWFGLLVAYAVFWFALVVVVNGFGRSSSANALILVGAWILLVLVAPVALNLLASWVSPTPSRTEVATRTRLITIDGLSRYNSLLSTDYRYVNRPELLLPHDGRIDMPDRLRALYLVDKETDDRIQGLLDRFDSQMAGQQAFVRRYSVCSPAIVLHEAMASLAGNGSRRYEDFRHQVDAFHRSWRRFFEPRILTGIAVAEADFRQMPQFTWKEEEGLVGDALLALLQVILPAGVLACAGLWLLRRYHPA